MTEQAPDIIVHRRRRRALLTWPLEPYLDGLAIDRRAVLPPWSTGCWRGYVASWRIAGGELLLTELSQRVCLGTSWAPERPVSLPDGLPWLRPPVPARWFTGWLHIDEGHQGGLGPCRPDHGFSELACERWIRVDRGSVVREEVHESPPWMVGYHLDRPPRRRRPGPTKWRGP